MIGTLTPNSKLRVQDTGTTKGRGVFALRAYAAGEAVEASPVLELPIAWDDLAPELRHMVFDWGFLLGTADRQLHCLALGLGSLFNHSVHPSLAYRADQPRQAMIFTAMRDIAEGEELTIDYNADIHPRTGVDWFQQLGITLVS